MLKKLTMFAGLVVLAVALATVSGFAQVVATPDVCSTLLSADVTNPPATNTATIGVASNFYYPALKFVSDYLSTVDDTAITVCHNATATLLANIGNYNMFFAADDSATTFDGWFDYAHGIPVLFAPYNAAAGGIANVGGLISGWATPTDTAATIESSVLSGYDIAASLKISASRDVAVAFPTLAPYGEAAEDILTAMGNAVNFNVQASPTPDWIYAPLSDNIAQTFNIVAGGTTTAKAGFISKAQICAGIAPNIPSPNTPDYVYVAFTGEDYLREQTAALTPTSNATSASLNVFIQKKINNGSWGTFLADNCYQ
ncbi:MAG: hypothetical protein LBT74_12280 [Acidobacteriota bacterium]|jgi:hypothetical protein|nr:hypothetical protein [Acidobacteriota bacterium]